jgi:hypothetical protein
MGAYEPTQAANKYSTSCQEVSRRVFINKTDLFAVCHNLGQILRIEIVIRDLLRAREIVNQYFQSTKLIVVESAMIAV